MSISIQIENLTYKLNESKKNLFKIDSLKILNGEKILIKGPSGKGKTTFLHILGGLLPITNSKISVLGQELSTLSHQQKESLYKNKVSFIFQKLNLIEFLTVKENVLIANCAEKDAEVILKKLGMENLLYQLCQKLSLGERQRVAVARALAKTSQIILADEPTSSLDDVNAKSVAQLLTADKNKTVLVVSHDSRLEKYFDKVIQFEDFST